MSAEGFIFAGGASRRMGRDKALLDWHGRPLIQHVMELLGAIASPVRAVGRDDLPDREKGIGPMGGIVTALSITQTDLNFFMAVDLPLLTREFLKYFAEKAAQSKCRIVACKIDSEFPLLLAVRRSALPHASEYVGAGRKSVRGFIEAGAPEVIDSAEMANRGFSLSMFENLNTLQDYQRALGRNL